jgi:chromosome segregation ATPase
MATDEIGLREYFEQLIGAETARSDAQHQELIKALAALREAASELAAAHQSAHEREHEMNTLAVTKAQEVMENRLASMDQFREQLRDQAGTFVRRDLMDSEISVVEAKVRQNADRISALERKEANLAGRFTALGIGIGLVVIVVNVLLRFF